MKDALKPASGWLTFDRSGSLPLGIAVKQVLLPDQTCVEGRVQRGYDYLDRHSLNSWTHDLDDIVCMIEQVIGSGLA